VLAEYVDAQSLQVRWPNDLLASGRKLAGVLCERVRGAALIGIGVNIAANLVRAPKEVRLRATSVRALTGRTPSRGDLFAALAIALREEFASAGPRPGWHEELNRVLAFNGQPIAVDTGERVVHGVCAGVDTMGRLIVREGPTRHAIVSGRFVS
jgi:BirA family biotin operon repressor/biotin-[acetyl-CoA-carboxylase] ligase